MKDYREITIARLAQLGLGPMEVITESGVPMDRYFIRDLVDGRKKTVRASSLPALAAVLRLDLDALVRGEMVPIEDVKDDGLITAQVAEIARIMRDVDEDGRDAILGKARSIELGARQHERIQVGRQGPRRKDGS